MDIICSFYTIIWGHVQQNLEGTRYIHKYQNE